MMSNHSQAIFIFPYEEKLRSEQISGLTRKVGEFLQSWSSHGQTLSARASVEDNQFLIVSEPEGVSTGCSKDKLMRALEEINHSLQLRLAPANKFFVLSNSKVLALSRSELHQKYQSQELSDNNELYPCWITSGNEFEKLWKKPLRNFPSILPKIDLV